MLSIFVFILIVGGIGLLIQCIGLIFYIFSIINDNKKHKETALKCFVYGTAMFLGSGILCGAGMSLFN